MIDLKRNILAATMLLAISAAHSQSVLLARQQEMLRNRQLIEGDSLAESMLVNTQTLIAAADTQQTPSVQAKAARWQVRPLPASVTWHRNGQVPFDWNLGSMVPAKGMQYHVAAGVQLSDDKHWQLRLAPEWVLAENQPFETMSSELHPQQWRDYFRYYYNVTDIPEHMSGRWYRRWHPGQSSLRYKSRSFVYALSTESKWWGPGYRNALVLTNNAPGFPHFSFATAKPLQTRWGRLEGELLAGLLQASGERPPRSYAAFDGRFLYPDKNNEARYLTGLTINWQPKWTPGLYIGISKASYLYPSQLSSPLDVFPLQGFFGSKATRMEKEGTKASLGSMFIRYMLPEDQAEVYVEYGRKDRSILPWNLFTYRPYRNGYVAGVRKALPLKRKGDHIVLGAEITQLLASDPDLILNLESWYTHKHVSQGYTHLGKSLGAGIGPGSSSQTIEVNFVRGTKRIGIQLERLKHNADYYYAAMTYIGDFRRHWMQVGATLKADWDFGPLSLHSNLGMIRSLNHQWIVVEARPNYYFAAGNEYLNIASQLSVRYRF